MKYKGNVKNMGKRSKQDKSTTGQNTLTTDEAFNPQSIMDVSPSKKPRLQSVPNESSEESGFQPGPKEVVVLKVTEPFTYNVAEQEHRMIHATVATVKAFFQVKVFDIKHKNKFTPKNVIAISNYVDRDGFLEIYKSSTVTTLSADQRMNIPPALIKNANATPEISQICSQIEGKYVNRIFRVYKEEDCSSLTEEIESQE
ncbi:PREDICTED: LOW QUALITY PROTEIN: pyrin and HIN domain-containing protein 1-like [Chinchilla lanigera]|uniref:LOW QUALITY PROTEIN: pyrin and HIN domain-containing protein 1-like n=1 Tax=Chinchilla lanigera TaxID=34839 RepID=UPI000696FC7A|nr:PREDICTED: LOW QUALITY PROTEIN: pyrin and HIN domain-containing protein 1-like [Chinchilla lanigera]